MSNTLYRSMQALMTILIVVATLVVLYMGASIRSAIAQTYPGAWQSPIGGLTPELVLPHGATETYTVHSSGDYVERYRLEFPDGTVYNVYYSEYNSDLGIATQSSVTYTYP